ncbi:MAG: ribonuclease III [Gammaproteobacteria bacterium]|nr:ribonuclease III [Gammaproteobacteria bacterium]NNF67336.1 ribonuclease III [Gammaproteobacteria bacterium]
MAQLCARLDYEFLNPDLAHTALTHRSAGGQNNERLEFLGDAMLDLVISEYLYEHRPDASEGDLSRLRASLVKRESLAVIANEMGLGDYLTLGSGELRTGGFSRKSILADALEALLAAIYLDRGYPAAKKVVLYLFAERLENLPASAALRDPKTRLQEWLQGRGMAIPAYEVIAVSGQAHEQQFQVECQVESLAFRAIGNGTSRRRAEQDAASGMLQQISDGQKSSS